MGLIYGHVSQYGYPGEETPDSLTQAGKSAIGLLTPESLSVSPDVEQRLRSKGITIGTPVRLTLRDGRTFVRVWDDRTAQDKDPWAKKHGVLRDRFDFYSPNGFRNSIEGQDIVNVERAENVEPDLPEKNDESSGETPKPGYITPEPTDPLFEPASVTDWRGMQFGSPTRKANVASSGRTDTNMAPIVQTPSLSLSLGDQAKARAEREARLAAALALLPKVFGS